MICGGMHEVNEATEEEEEVEGEDKNGPMFGGNICKSFISQRNSSFWFFEKMKKKMSQWLAGWNR